MIDHYKDVLDKENKEKLIEYNLANFVDENNKLAVWCPTPDCKYVVFIDENDPTNTKFECPNCKK